MTELVSVYFLMMSKIFKVESIGSLLPYYFRFILESHMAECSIERLQKLIYLCLSHGDFCTGQREIFMKQSVDKDR